jgi:ribA/ribD-fused uncharacterized protein
METVALFEEKIPVTPRDLSRDTINITNIIQKKFRAKLEGHCSLHGWVKPNTVNILNRSVGAFGHGDFTGDIVYHVQAEGKVINPPSGIEVVGDVIRKNKMGMYVNYQDAVRIILPRDLHIGDDEYDSIQIGETIKVEIKKSRFQVNDEYILSVGLFKGRANAVAALDEPLSKVEEVEEEELEEEEAPEAEAEVVPVIEAPAPSPAPVAVVEAPVATTIMEPIAFSPKTPFRELSNLYPSPFTLDGKIWPSVEHYFQSQKFPSNPDYQEQIRTAKTPLNAKTLGGSSTAPVRADWDTVQEDIMRKALNAKFTQNPVLKSVLLSTGDTPLHDASSTDAYWGIGRTKKGKNRLGILLIELRSSLRAEGDE